MRVWEGGHSPCGALVLHHLCQREPLLTQSALLTGPFWDRQPSAFAFGRGVWRILPFLLGSPLGFQTSCIMDRILMEPGCLSSACWAFQIKTVTAALHFLLLLPSYANTDIISVLSLWTPLKTNSAYYQQLSLSSFPSKDFPGFRTDQSAMTWPVAISACLDRYPGLQWESISIHCHLTVQLATVLSFCAQPHQKRQFLDINALILHLCPVTQHHNILCSICPWAVALLVVSHWQMHQWSDFRQKELAYEIFVSFNRQLISNNLLMKSLWF